MFFSLFIYYLIIPLNYATLAQNYADMHQFTYRNVNVRGKSRYYNNSYNKSWVSQLSWGEQLYIHTRSLRSDFLPCLLFSSPQPSPLAHQAVVGTHANRYHFDFVWECYLVLAVQ